jgi:hypothetical protein
MSNALVEGLFLLAFWAPPATVVACALLLLVKAPAARRAPARAHAPAILH